MHEVFLSAHENNGIRIHLRWWTIRTPKPSPMREWNDFFVFLLHDEFCFLSAGTNNLNNSLDLLSTSTELMNMRPTHAWTSNVKIDENKKVKWCSLFIITLVSTKHHHEMDLGELTIFHNCDPSLVAQFKFPQLNSGTSGSQMKQQEKGHDIYATI